VVFQLALPLLRRYIDQLKAEKEKYEEPEAYPAASDGPNGQFPTSQPAPPHKSSINFSQTQRNRVQTASLPITNSRIVVGAQTKGLRKIIHRPLLLDLWLTTAISRD